MKPSPQIIYPTIDLFLYDLHDGFGQSVEDIKENRQRFWQRIYNHTLDQEQLEKLKAREENLSHYIELLDDQRVEKFKHPHDGYYYPVKLGDTYALQIDYTANSNWNEANSLETLTKCQQIIVEHIHQLPGKMGQSWLIWGKLADANQDMEATAKECYLQSQIFPKANWKKDYKGKGTFQGATFFELEQYHTSSDGYNHSYHVIICLFPHQQNQTEITKTSENLYGDLMKLFQYRHKIIWLYQQSREIKQTLKNASRTVQKIVDSLSQRVTDSSLNLTQLQKDLANALSISHYYQTNLSYLQEHHSTIEINIHNYQKRIKTMSKKDSHCDLVFLEEFSEFATEKCLHQLKSDYQSLSAGFKPLEKFITTVQGIIDIEKTKNERTLNKTIAIASVGIGTATLASSSLTGQIKEIVQTLVKTPISQPTPAYLPWLNFGVSFSLCLLIGIISAFIMGLFLKKESK